MLAVQHALADGPVGQGKGFMRPPPAHDYAASGRAVPVVMVMGSRPALLRGIPALA
jgi:hypothetical protein